MYLSISRNKYLCTEGSYSSTLTLNASSAANLYFYTAITTAKNPFTKTPNCSTEKLYPPLFQNSDTYIATSIRIFWLLYDTSS